jgi:putative membrane protein
MILKMNLKLKKNLNYKKNKSVKNTQSKEISNLPNIDVQEKILILSVDRDDDIGKLIGVSGPIIGYENNLKMATNLILKDPEESDANCVFGALKKYNFLKKDYVVEIATLTGHSKDNLFFADKNILEQLNIVLAKFPASGIVFVTDGSEDDQVIPLIQNYVPIISKEVVIVRQSKHIESMFYTVKKALKDPVFARIVFGVPAFVLLLLFFLGFKYTFQILALVLGVYFLLKGFNLEPKIVKAFTKLISKFSLTKICFAFYLVGFFFLIFGVISGVNLYIQNVAFEYLLRIIYVLRAILGYLVISALVFTIGDVVDLFYLKEVYKLGKHIFIFFAIIVFSALLDFGLQLILNLVTINTFIISVVLFSVLLVLLNKITNIFDVTNQLTELFIGLPVVSRYGMWVGEVISIDQTKNIIKYKTKNSKTIKAVSKNHFVYNEGRIII